MMLQACVHTCELTFHLCPCRGRLLYQLSLSLWRLLCLCYYAEVRLEVLKLTKHMEDGTIKARWRVKGLPFHSLLLRFYYKDKSQLYRYQTKAPCYTDARCLLCVGHQDHPADICIGYKN